MTFDPTPEQTAALDLFTDGDSMVIEAGAGTGKTSTLQLLADSTARHGRYLAFNKAIVTDVSGRLPDTCIASTAHSLAFRAVGKPFAHRLGGARMKSWLLAQMLDLDPLTISYEGHRKRLAAEYLAGHVMRAVKVFCQTADETPSRRHFPYIDGIDAPTSDGKRTYTSNDFLAVELEPALRRAWTDLSRPDGQLPYDHGAYLKLWQLSHPTTTAEYILFDEAQDASAVLAAVIAEQTHAQRVYVGDPCQAIYEWAGAIDAIERMKESGLAVSTLSGSFRFGPEIASVANEWLTLLDSDLRLSGLGTPGTTGELDSVDDADAVLCRTNAGAVHQMLLAQRRGIIPHLVGGGAQVLSFARGAADLKEKGQTYHPELACFDSWQDVQQYVQNDPAGGELRLLVALVDEFGVETIRRALEHMPTEHAAGLVISTAHKAKGRQWPVVQIDSDFEDIELSDPELRLQYVAITRAAEHLDHTVLATKPAERPLALPSVSGEA